MVGRDRHAGLSRSGAGAALIAVLAVLVSAALFGVVADLGAAAGSAGSAASDPAAADSPPPPEPVPVSAATDRSDAGIRARSRSEYSNQTAERALQTLRQKHPGLLPPPWRSLADSPHPVKAYIGDHAAQLDLGNGRHGLVESVLPLRARDASGTKVPLDFGLDERGAFFAPHVPLVAVRLPKRLSDGIELPDIGVAVTPMNAGAGAPAQRAEGSVFWANAGGRDTDVIAMPVPSGFQVLGYLRSAESPEGVSLHLTLPAGAHAKRSGSEGGIVIERGDDVLARISPPVAYDADGTRFESSYTLEGDTLTARVAHRDAHPHYPIVLDPVVAEDQRHWHTNGGIDFNGWASGSVGGSPFVFWPGDWWLGRGLYIYDADAFYTNGHYGYWSFNAPGSESFVYAAEFHYVRTVDQDTCLREGITNSAGGWLTNTLWCNANLNYEGHGHCAAPGCPSTAGAANNSARFHFLAAYYNKYRDWFWGYFGGALVWLNDLTPPTLSWYGPNSSSWVHSTPRSLAPLGRDNGLGIKQWKLSLPGQPDRYRTHDCAGHRNDRCPYASGVTGVSPNAPRTSGDDFTYSTGILPDGINEVRGYAADFAGNWSPPLIDYVKVDHSPPQIALSGTLAAADGRTLDHSSIYRLQVDATDGTASDPRVGVKSIEILVDDARQDYAEQACTPDSCAMKHEWNLVPAAFAPGRHTIEVTATDQLGHSSTRELTVDVPESTGCGGGSVDLRSPVFAVSTLRLVGCPGARDKEVAVDTRVRADGVAANNYAGSEIANVGDVNGDGRPDLAVVAPYASTNGKTQNGAVYIVYGRSTAPDLSSTGPNATTVPLGSLGTGGFRIDGNWPGEKLANVVGLGDINGDGRDDLAVSNSNAAHLGRVGGGWVFVVFGKSGSTNVDLAALGSGGYRIFGAAAGDSTGASLARLDDLNGDGRAELAIGAPNADNNSRAESGSVYVVYSKATTSDIDLAALGTDGFRVDGPPASSPSFGINLLAAGADFNGDAKPDIVVGNSWASPNGRTRAGSAWVVFGQAGSGNIDLNSPGTSSYRVDGAVGGDQLGSAAAGVGDLDSDGISEVAIGAPRASNNHGGGSVYVITGKPRVGTLDAREPLGTEGYRIDGDNTSRGVGSRLARMSDVNGDNIPDLGIGADSGGVYVVYGQATHGSVDLSLRTFNGYRIDGAGSWPSLADAGDFLATGTPTIAIGDDNLRMSAGSVYLLDAKPRLQ